MGRKGWDATMVLGMQAHFTCFHPPMDERGGICQHNLFDTCFLYLRTLSFPLPEEKGVKVPGFSEVVGEGSS